MKTILQKLMCMAVAAMACMSVNAQTTSGSCGDNATWEYDNGTLTIAGTGEITTYSTENPTAYPWFAQLENIQTVIIGEGITNIPAWAFAMYENLRSIHLPSTLKTIGWSCLEETNLWNVSLPEGLETIESYAFMMTPFSTVSIPSTVTEIGERAFGYCENLVSVGCYADVPPTLGSNAFGDSPNIETVYVQSTKIATYKDADGWSPFGDKIQSPAGYCGPDGNDEDGDDDVTKATWSFDMATHTLTIEGTKMGQYNRPWESSGMGGQGGGFNPDNNVGYPQGIYHIVIGEGITDIPAMAFYMEVGVTDVVLPSTLESIGMGVFGECFNLSTLTINAVTPPTLGEDVFMDCPTIPTIIVPAASVDNYKAAPGWSTYADKIVAGDAPAATLSLADNADNTAAIAAKNGTVCDVTLTGRTLQTGSYNTFAVPFDISAAELSAKGITAKKLAASSFADGVLSLTFADAATIEAGKPYLVKVSANVVNPVFEGVTISNTTTNTETTAVDFIPTMGKTEVTGDAESTLFLGAANTLYYPTSLPADMKGFRAYFVVKGEAALAPARGFSMDFGDGETTSINEELRMKNEEFATAPVYDLQGRKVNAQPNSQFSTLNSQLKKGVYIVNGKKVIK